MGVETASFISQLDPQAPQGGESISQGDDHLRTIKTAVKGSFPKINSVVNATPEDLNDIIGIKPVVDQLETDVTALKASSGGNVASCYFVPGNPNGGLDYAFNVDTVDIVPGNNLATRVTFNDAISNSTTNNRYAFALTPVVDSSSEPSFITVHNATSQYIDFTTLEFSGGTWDYIPGASHPFSLIAIDMESGR